MMKKFSLVFIAFSLCASVLVTPASTEQIRAGVADFVDRAAQRVEIYSMTTYLPLREVTEEFIKVLNACSDKIEVTGSKSFQTLNAASLKDLADTVKSTGCQYLILGALARLDNDLSYSNKSSLLGSIPETSIYTYIAALDIKVIEVNTGKIIFSTTGTGKASFSERVKSTMKDIGSKKLVYRMADNHEKTLKQSLFKASSMTAEKICAFLTGEYPQVTEVNYAKSNKSKKKPVSQENSKSKSSKSNKKNELVTININRGSKQGIYEKSCYRVFYEGEEIFDFAGNSLGRKKFNIAVAEVSTLKSTSCIASVIGGSPANIHKGDKAELITPEEALTIIDNNDFVKNRLSNL